MLASLTSCPEAVIFGLQPNLHGAPSSTIVEAPDVKDVEVRVKHVSSVYYQIQFVKVRVFT